MILSVKILKCYGTKNCLAIDTFTDNESWEYSANNVGPVLTNISNNLIQTFIYYWKESQFWWTDWLNYVSTFLPYILVLTLWSLYRKGPKEGPFGEMIYISRDVRIMTTSSRSQKWVRTVLNLNMKIVFFK